MQTWHKNKNKKDNFREVNLVNIIICATDIWKKNMLKDLEIGELEYMAVEEFLADLRKKILRGDDKMMKIVELKRIKQESRMMEEFVQEFRRVARESSYKRWPLVEEFKIEMNGVIRRKLIEVEYQYSSKSIEQWYKRAVNPDRH